LAGIEQLYTGNLLTVVLAHYTHSYPDEFTALPEKWLTCSI